MALQIPRQFAFDDWHEVSNGDSKENRMSVQPSYDRRERETDTRAPLQSAGRFSDLHRSDAESDPSGGVGDLGAESGTAPGQPAWGTRAIAPSAGETLWEM